MRDSGRPPMDMDARAIPRRVFEWIFRPAALREARAALRAPDDPREAAARQARLVLEVARRTAEPAEALPPGGQPAVLLALYRDAIYWALAARRPDRSPPPADLRALWDASNPQLVGGIAAGQRRIGRPAADAVRRLRAARAGGQRRGRRARAHLRRGARVGHGRPAAPASSASFRPALAARRAGCGGRAGAC